MTNVAVMDHRAVFKGFHFALSPEAHIDAYADYSRAHNPTFPRRALTLPFPLAQGGTLFTRHVDYPITPSKPSGVKG